MSNYLVRLALVVTTLICIYYFVKENQHTFDSLVSDNRFERKSFGEDIPNSKFDNIRGVYVTSNSEHGRELSDPTSEEYIAQDLYKTLTKKDVDYGYAFDKTNDVYDNHHEAFLIVYNHYKYVLSYLTRDRYDEFADQYLSQ